MIRALALTLLLALPAAADEIEDRYAGYHYPAVTTEETFSRVIAPGTPPAEQAVRVNFVTSITKAQLAAPESPRYVIFEKGAKSDRLIIVALDDEIFRTPFRARAVLAQLTSNMRGTEFFRQQDLHLEGTLYDMLQIMGFSSLVLSDGATWSHRVNFVAGG